MDALLWILVGLLAGYLLLLVLVSGLPWRRRATPGGAGKTMRLRVLALVLVLMLAAPALAQSPVVLTQRPSLTNSESTSAANTAVAVTIAGVTNQRVRLYGVTVRCSAGSANLTVSSGGTQVWSSDAAFVSTTSRAVAWTPVPLTTATGGALVVTLGACGAGNTGTLDVQADQG